MEFLITWNCLFHCLNLLDRARVDKSEEDGEVGFLSWIEHNGDILNFQAIAAYRNKVPRTLTQASH
jgi:hypothetical protein